jgi:hypothetical protein
VDTPPIFLNTTFVYISFLIVNPDFDSRKNNIELKRIVADARQACATKFSLFVRRSTLGGGLRPIAENSL